MLSIKVYFLPLFIVLNIIVVSLSQLLLIEVPRGLIVVEIFPRVKPVPVGWKLDAHPLSLVSIVVSIVSIISPISVSVPPAVLPAVLLS